jgi:hypothetical protein
MGRQPMAKQKVTVAGGPYMACMDSIPSHAMQHTNGQLALVVHYRETLKPPPHQALSGACFSCLLAHDFRPCLVLHRTMQHGSTCSSVQQKKKKKNVLCYA